jgi:hypothetical protein
MMKAGIENGNEQLTLAKRAGITPLKRATSRQQKAIGCGLRITTGRQNIF